MKLVIGTRGSLLARAQTGIIAEWLTNRGNEVELLILETRGDRETHAPVPELGGKGLFTAELEDALRSGRIDLAVHSLKDLPTDDVPDLIVAAVPVRGDWKDALISRGPKLMKLPSGARVGTASLRRRALLLRRRPDLQVVPLRGNVDTRIQKVRDGAVDAAVLAVAGLARLGRPKAIKEYLDFLPAPAQGALALQARGDRPDVIRAARAIHDRDSELCTRTERALLKILGGGCSVPVGALCKREGKRLVLRAIVAAPDGSRVAEAEGVGGNPAAVGADVAAKLRALGAQEILDACRGMIDGSAGTFDA